MWFILNGETLVCSSLRWNDSVYTIRKKLPNTCVTVKRPSSASSCIHLDHMLLWWLTGALPVALSKSSQVDFLPEELLTRASYTRNQSYNCALVSFWMEDICGLTKQIDISIWAICLMLLFPIMCNKRIKIHVSAAQEEKSPLSAEHM